MQKAIGAFILALAAVLLVVYVVVVSWNRGNAVFPSGSGDVLSAKIVSPRAGVVYTLSEGKALASIKVRVSGDPANGPYRLTVRDAQLDTFQESKVTTGAEKVFVFHLSIPGTGYFTVFVEDKNGNHATDRIAYSVNQ